MLCGRSYQAYISPKSRDPAQTTKRNNPADHNNMLFMAFTSALLGYDYVF
jgi:hypothetical protein